jgi:hypothetical protein
VKWALPLIAAFLFLTSPPRLLATQPSPRVVHVFVALADNQHQGIVPVPARLGNGDVPAANLYWGSAFGVRTFFKSSADWVVVAVTRGPKREILERCVFRSRNSDVYLVADAYEGSKIREAVADFLGAAAGQNEEAVSIEGGETAMAGGASDLVAYVGHDAFMDFQIPPIAGKKQQKPRSVMILACASKQYFGSYLRDAGAEPLLWTTGLMAPEAYTLKAALDGWIAHEDGRAIRDRAAHAYDKYQHCGFSAAQRLFATGW